MRMVKSYFYTTFSYQEDKPINLYTVVLDHFKAVLFRKNLKRKGLMMPVNILRIKKLVVLNGINSLEKKTTFSIFYSYLYLYYNGT